MCVCVINAYQLFFLQMGSPDSSICAQFNVDCTMHRGSFVILQVEEPKRCSRGLQCGTRLVLLLVVK